MCALFPVSGRPDAVRHQVVPVAGLGRRDVVISPQRLVSVAQTVLLPSIHVTIQMGGNRGFHFLQACRCPRISSGSMGADRTQDSGHLFRDSRYQPTVGGDHRLPCQLASSLYATHSCAPLPNRSRTYSQSVHPYPTIYPQEAQRKVCVQLSAPLVAFPSPFAFLRLEPAIISLDIGEYTQWLS